MSCMRAKPISRATHRAAAADEDAARSLGQREERGFVRDADMRGRGGLESAAQRRAVQRRDEGNVAARHRFEIGVAIERKRQPLRAPGLPAFRGPAQVEPGAELSPWPKMMPHFASSPARIDRLAQGLHHVRVEAVALVRTVEADQGDLALELVGDHVSLRS